MIKEQLENGRWKFTCEKCRYVRITANENYAPICSCMREHTIARQILDEERRKNLPEPNALMKARNFAKAAYNHAAAGRPQATDEQVAERFAICQVCEIFKPKEPGSGVCTHPSCGCNLKAVGIEGLNKLRWADQACPLGKWEAIK